MATIAAASHRKMDGVRLEGKCLPRQRVKAATGDTICKERRPGHGVMLGTPSDADAARIVSKRSGDGRPSPRGQHPTRAHGTKMVALPYTEASSLSVTVSRIVYGPPRANTCGKV